MGNLVFIKFSQLKYGKVKHKALQIIWMRMQHTPVTYSLSFQPAGLLKHIFKLPFYALILPHSLVRRKRVMHFFVWHSLKWEKRQEKSDVKKLLEKCWYGKRRDGKRHPKLWKWFYTLSNNMKYNWSDNEIILHSLQTFMRWYNSSRELSLGKFTNSLIIVQLLYALWCVVVVGVAVIKYGTKLSIIGGNQMH